MKVLFGRVGFAAVQWRGGGPIIKYKEIIKMLLPHANYPHAGHPKAAHAIALSPITEGVMRDVN